MKKSILTAGLAIALAACTHPNPARFDRGDMPQQQFARDDYECERDARIIPGDACAQMNMFERCMKSKGYSAIPGSANKGGC